MMQTNQRLHGQARMLLTIALLSAFVLAGSVVEASASTFFEWVCDDASCDGDPGFSAFLELSDSAVAAGDFTGVAGNILSAGITSSVGDGFSLDLGDMLTGLAGSNSDDVNNIRIVLDAGRNEILDLIDVSAGTNITFGDLSVGRVDFLEGTGGTYYVQLVQDLSPVTVSLTDIGGRFVRGAPAGVIPEPRAALVFAVGALVVSSALRRRSS